MKNFLISCITTMFFFSLNAQQGKLYHKTFTKEDGLEIDIIKAMAFDDDGFLWLGGENLDIRTIILSDKKLVIQRFNGETFHSIPLPEFHEKLIRIDRMYKRHDGKFYIQAIFSTGQKLLLFDPYAISFTTVLEAGLSKDLKTISHVFSYKGDVIVMTQEGDSILMNRINDDLTTTLLFSFQQAPYKFLLDASTKFLPFKDYCIIGDDNFPLLALDWNGNKIKEYSGASFKRERDIAQNKFYIDEHFMVGDSCFVYMNNDPELYFLDETEIEFRKKPSTSSGNLLHEIYSDAFNNTMSFSVENDKLTFSRMQDGQFQVKYTSDFFDNSNAIQTISNNLNEDVWIGTSNNELHYFKFPSEKIKNYLRDFSIRTIFEIDSENYIVATETNGWFTLNTKNQQIKKYNLYEKGVPIDPRSSRNIIRKGGTLWSNSGGSIISINPATSAVDAYRHFPVICLESLNDSTLIYGTNSYNLMEFSTVTKQHRPLVTTDSLIIYDLAIKDDYVVGATDKGILSYNLKNKEVDLIKGTEGITDPFFLMVDVHKTEQFVLGSRNGTVLTFNPKTGNVKPIYRDPLEAGIAAIVYEDAKWWISTFNGMVVWNKNDNSTKRYFERDGLSNNEGNRYSILKTASGIFSGTLKGLNFFEPDLIDFNEMKSELVVLKLRNYDPSRKKIRNQFNRNTFADLKIGLPSEYRELEVDFGITNNVVNRVHTYRYSLNDSDWTTITQPSIHFPNLAAGSYLLKIEAWDASAKKIGNTLELSIHSKNFFYKTWWFYGLTLLVLSALFYYFLKQAITRKKMQEDFSANLMESQENERTRIAKELHDSVGQQLTLIKKRAQKEDLRDITKMTHNALEEIREISRGLYPTILKQLGLTESIGQLIFDLDERSPIFFSAEIDEIDSVFNERQTLNFYRFIQECMSNVLKHSEATTVSLSIQDTQTKLLLEITDNGKGFEYNNQLKQNSLGLKTMAERIRMLNGTLFIDSRPGRGTKIRVEIPKT
jgi:signal transduction histidine kinase